MTQKIIPLEFKRLTEKTVNSILKIPFSSRFKFPESNLTFGIVFKYARNSTTFLKSN